MTIYWHVMLIDFITSIMVSSICTYTKAEIFVFQYVCFPVIEDAFATRDDSQQIIEKMTV